MASIIVIEDDPGIRRAVLCTLRTAGSGRPSNGTCHSQRELAASRV
jgi:hypothetical protein